MKKNIRARPADFTKETLERDRRRLERQRQRAGRNEGGTEFVHSLLVLYLYLLFFFLSFSLCLMCAGFRSKVITNGNQ